MNDLIRREDVAKTIQHICDLCGEQDKYNGIMCGSCYLDTFVLDDIPSAEPERTAKVIKHKYWLGVSLNIVGEQTIGYEWLCENCKKKVIDGDDYCSHCGARLDWGEADD